MQRILSFTLHMSKKVFYIKYSEKKGRILCISNKMFFVFFYLFIKTFWRSFISVYMSGFIWDILDELLFKAKDITCTQFSIVTFSYSINSTTFNKLFHPDHLIQEHIHVFMCAIRLNWELGTCYIFCFEQKFIKFIYPLASPFTWVRRCFTSS
jgi:hypothetical protein